MTLDFPATKEPPADLDAEQTLLSELIARPAFFDTARGIIKASDFADPAHRLIYEAAEALADGSGGLILSALAKQVEDLPDVAELGGRTYIGELAANALRIHTYASIAHQCQYIAELSRKRDLIGLSQSFADSAYVTDEPINTQIAKLERGLADIQSRGAQEGATWAQSLTEALADYETAYTNGGAIQGLPTGFTAIDEHLGGLERGNLYILAARPGMGKTALAGNILYNTASIGAHVAFFSLEMPEKQVAGRIVCTAAGLPFHNVRRGMVRPDAFHALNEARDHVSSLSIRIDARSGIGPAYIRGRCQAFGKQQSLDLVIVDYLQLMESDVDRRGGNRAQEVTDISKALKTLAKALDVPVLCLSQLNRGVESRDDKRPTLSDLRESGSIEQDADAVVFIYREEYYLRRAEPDPADPNFDDWAAKMEGAKGKADIDIAKNRHGPEGRCLLRFNGPLMQFTNPEANPWQTD